MLRALPEQVVDDVLASAFDSAGQRCSALRVLCVQEEIADRVLAMLRGAMHELAVGDPAQLSTDIGPIIDAEAQRRSRRTSRAWRARRPLRRMPLDAAQRRAGHFVAPAIIEIALARRR